jgi:probable O-glycosylation ligase (exosortase A-associated)
MDPALVFKFIGTVFFQQGVLTLIFLVVFGTAAVKGFNRPVVAIALYFSASIINPQSSAPLFYSIPMAKLAFVIAFFSLLKNSDQARIFFPGQFFIMLVFLLFSNLSAWNALIPELAGKRQGEFNKIALVCFIAVWVIQTRKDYQTLFCAAAFSFYYNVLKNLVETQTKGRWYAVTGTGGWIGDSNDWALALAMALPLFYVLIIQSKTWKWRLFHTGASLSSLLVMTITSSRGGFLGALGAASILLLTERRKFRAILVILMMLPILAQYAPESYMDQVESIFHAKESADEMLESGQDPHGSGEYTGAERIWNWKIAYEMMQDHPYVGVGWGSYVPARRFYEAYPGDTVTHSTWFQVGAEAGYTGLISFVMMILVAFLALFRVWWRAAKAKDTWVSLHARAIMAGLVAFCISGSFVSREYSDLLFLYFCFAVILPKLFRETVPETAPVPDKMEEGMALAT